MPPIPVLPPVFVTAGSVLLIACPGAMGLAKPAAIMVGIGKDVESGMLFRCGIALEQLARIDAVVLDRYCLHSPVSPNQLTCHASRVM